MHAVDDADVIHCMRLAVKELVTKKTVGKSSCQHGKIPLLPINCDSGSIHQPALDLYPNGLAATELAHLLRCRHLFRKKRTQDAYQQYYDANRDCELGENSDPVPSQEIQRLVVAITSAKLMCGMFTMKEKTTSYRKKLIDLMMSADSVMESIYQSIGSCTCATISIGGVIIDATSQLMKMSHSFPFPCLKNQPQTLSSHPIKSVVDVHSILLNFKINCGSEYARFMRQSSLFFLVLDAQNMVHDSEGKLRLALRNRNETVDSAARTRIDAVIGINKHIWNWSKEVVKKLAEYHQRLLTRKKAHIEPTSLRRHAAIPKMLAIDYTPMSVSPKGGQRYVKRERDTPVASRTRRTGVRKHHAPDSHVKKHVSKKGRSLRSTTRRRAISYKDPDSQDTESSEEELSPHVPCKRKRPSGQTSISKSKKKEANNLIREMDRMIKQLRIRTQRFEKYADVSDGVLKKNFCKNIEYYKTFKPYKRRSI